MNVECRHCEETVHADIEACGGVFRCPKCEKVNVVINAESEGAISFAEEYEIVEEVGIGANAIVCKARKKASGDVVALKIFFSRSDVNTHSRREFLREVNFSVGIVHENIVRTYSGDEYDGILFLELEFVEGINLLEYVEYYGAMDQYDALAVAAQVAAALDYVWNNHLVIHRDIKPQNIMVDEEGYVKVCDFGMVTYHERAAVDVSAVEGTPYYLSPECVTDGAYQDNRSDIYSLGATLYHVIAEVPPFNYDSLLEVVNARLTEEAPSIQDEAENIDPRVGSVLQTMMQRDPERRYVTAFECMEDVERVQRGEDPILVDVNRPKVNVDV
jgi:serine/threonine protein kinase